MRGIAVATVFACVAGAASTGCSSSDQPEPTSVARSAVAPSGGAQLLFGPGSSDLALAWILSGQTVVATQPVTPFSSHPGAYDAFVDGSNIIIYLDVTGQNSTGLLPVETLDDNGKATFNGDLSFGKCDATCQSQWAPVGRTTFHDPALGVRHGLMWYNVTTGFVSIWMLSGFAVTATLSVSQPCGHGCLGVYHPLTTADFDGDGNSDIAWIDDAGTVSVWLLDSSAKVIGSQTLSWTCDSDCQSHWIFAGTADVNGDGHLDITWYNLGGDGTISSWLLDGRGNVLGTYPLSKRCVPGASDCPNFPLGYISFP